jgi:hypothetical protein
VQVSTPGFGWSDDLCTRQALNPAGKEGTPLLSRVLVPMDARLGVGPQDAEVMAGLVEARLPCCVAL